MRQLLTFALILVFAGSAAAMDLGSVSNPAPKDDSHVLQNPTFGRDGGDDMASAAMITALPFNDTGSTGGSSDAFDAVCPYSGSTSPDKWYSFTPAADTGVSVDLCGSSYDTKTYIVDGSYNIIACNDDFYFDATCGTYVSFIEAASLTGGMTYYIVVDGYGGDFGDYIISVNEVIPPEPCVLECDGVAEGEPTLNDGYVDNYNGGCNTPPANPFQDLVADQYGNLLLCGVSGWYTSAEGGASRDTDWFTVTFGAAGTITWEMDAEVESYFFLLAPQDCGTVAVAEQVLAGPCAPGVLVLSGAPGSVAWIWAGPSDFAPPVGFVGNEYAYTCNFSGMQEGPIATEPTSFDSIKSMYR
jgi:hypothetical protein